VAAISVWGDATRLNSVTQGYSNETVSDFANIRDESSDNFQIDIQGHAQASDSSQWNVINGTSRVSGTGTVGVTYLTINVAEVDDSATWEKPVGDSDAYVALSTYTLLQDQACFVTELLPYIF
jgi:hypothetical protein